MLIFRKASENDIEKVGKIYSDIHSCEEQGMVTIGWIRDIYPTLGTAQKAFERGDLFVAEENEEIVGSAIINKQQVEAYKKGKWRYNAHDEEVMVLHTLVIAPKYSGKGYGKKFVDFYEQYSLSNNCKYLRMDTNLRNLTARAMYKKLGYIECDIVECVFNGISGVDLVLLEKKLK